MATIETLIGEIRLKQNEIEAISQAKKRLLATILNRASEELLPRPLDMFLIGSYSRGTKITPLDDVDIFYVMGNAEKTSDNWHQITDCSLTFGSDFCDDNDNISSAKILELLKRQLKETYSSSRITRNDEVVNIYLLSHGVGFDVAPAFLVTNKDYYLMPLGGASTMWKQSNPKKDVEILDRLQQKHNNYLKNTLRIVKYWFKRKKIKSPRAYHLESISYLIFNQIPPVNSYLQSLLAFYYTLGINDLLDSCPDPTGLSGALTSDLLENDIHKIQAEAEKAADYLNAGESAFVQYVAPEL